MIKEGSPELVEKVERGAITARIAAPPGWTRGELSIRNIGRAAGVGESTIRAHAKRDGWERDLSEDVRKKVRSAQSVRIDD